MVVSWLPPAAREEFLISRELAAANLRFWCFSAWTRSKGLDLGAPVFVTDLSDSSRPPVAQNANRAELASLAGKRASERSSLPFAESLLVVPLLPPLANSTVMDFALVPEDSSIETKRRNERQKAEAVTGLVGLAMWAITKETPDFGKAKRMFDEMETNARGIPYTLGPRIETIEWILALLAAIGTARVEEFLARMLSLSRRIDVDAVQRWASQIGPPQPIENWKDAMSPATYPFLLVPPVLWREMGADQASRRFRMLSRLVKT